ncbi:hypothetical protein FKG94_13425 [Exilibacterium tricleocarpae]|uniref:Uncharacterized protein n=1 Tax=Exilibacterium tricleocarpae TaxID=2591008 RepID=A0A545TLM1_9GAMM|nr:hypothetical protein [Exilibacterium tricleocarpae]TQV78076.1 hypothetical protein FKG94_13425 [Exilibacterium tricleocarpae]
MQYEPFSEAEANPQQFPCGRYRLNSCELRALLQRDDCAGVGVRVLHLGTVALDRAELLERLRDDRHPRLDDIAITCLDSQVIIDEPSRGAR